jgi:Ser/Thr protein kinase RdoA (MazF antagonist)
MTPDEAARLAREAAAAWGGKAEPALLKLRENAVFAVALPDTVRGALRLHRRGYQTEAAIRSELWWLEALADLGVPVPRPLCTPEGEVVVRLSDGRIASMLSWVEGEALGEAGQPLPGDAADQTRLHAAIGRLLAELHVTSDRLHLPASFQRPRWDVEGLLGPSPFWGPFWEHPEALPHEAACLAEARRLAEARLADFAAQGADQGLIHADVLRENVLVTEHRVALIDFDDAGFGFRLYDLGTALSQNLSEPNLPAIVTGLVEGYATLRPLDAAEREMLPWFTLLRCLASVGWTMPRLPAGDPRHRLYIERAVRAGDIVLAGGDLFAAP